MPLTQRRIINYIIIIAVLGYPLLCLLLTRGIELSDPALYIRSSLSFAEGNHAIHPTVVSVRTGLVLMTALFIRLFGLNFYGLALFPLLCSIGLIILLLSYCKDQQIRRLAAVLLFVTNPLLLTLGTSIGPDLPAVLLVTAAFIIIIRLHVEPGKNQLLNGLLAGCSLAGSILFKEIVFFSLPALAFFFVRDLLQRQNLRFWLTTAVISLLFTAGYFSYFQLTTGNFFYRFSTIEAEHNSSQFSYHGQSWTSIAKRATYQPLIHILLSKDYIVLSVLTLGYFLAKARRPERFQRPLTYTDYMAIYFLITLAAYWLGSTSLTHYNPLPVSSGRMWLILIPPMILLSSSFIDRLTSTISNGQTKFPAFWVYLPLSLLFLYSLKGIYNERMANSEMANNYFTEKKFFDTLVRQPPENTLVITDRRLVELSSIYRKKIPGTIAIRSWESFLEQSLSQPVHFPDSVKVLVLINRQRAEMLYKLYSNSYLPDWRRLSGTYPVISATGDISILRFTGKEFSLRTFPGTLPRMMITPPHTE